MFVERSCHSPCADPQTLKGLMEDEDRIERGKFVANHAKVEADNDRVDDYAKFENEEGGDLLPV